MSVTSTLSRKKTDLAIQPISDGGDCTRDEEFKALTIAFDKFNELSSRLEQRYDQLSQEANSLRIQLEQKEAELKRSERLSTLGQTAAALAHEIRNPLGAITLFVSLLESEVAQNPSACELIGHISKSVKNLDHVVSNILHFAKDGTKNIAPFNLHSIIREQVELLGSQFPRVKVTTDFKSGDYLSGNDHNMRQLFMNLLKNAAEAMKGEGDIEIRTESLAEPASTVITVTDSGPGLCIEESERVFEPFFTTKNGGTGLGLAIVKKIVEEHEGRITVAAKGSPEMGKSGAKFEIKIPAGRKKENSLRVESSTY